MTSSEPTLEFKKGKCLLSASLDSYCQWKTEAAYRFTYQQFILLMVTGILAFLPFPLLPLDMYILPGKN